LEDFSLTSRALLKFFLDWKEILLTCKGSQIPLKYQSEFLGIHFMHITIIQTFNHSGNWSLSFIICVPCPDAVHHGQWQSPVSDIFSIRLGDFLLEPFNVIHTCPSHTRHGWSLKSTGKLNNNNLYNKDCSQALKEKISDLINLHNGREKWKAFSVILSLFSGFSILQKSFSFIHVNFVHLSAWRKKSFAPILAAKNFLGGENIAGLKV